jgi:hypothetical protein
MRAAAEVITRNCTLDDGCLVFAVTADGTRDRHDFVGLTSVKSSRGCLGFSSGFGLLFSFVREVKLFTAAEDNGIELLLDFAQQPRRVDAWKIPVDMLVDDFDERKKFSH